jgi:uncharacterized membrane protein YdbT with pleckstrin-like domain
MENFRRFHFDGQKNGEEIVMVIHRHWFNILEKMSLVFFMLLILFASAIYLPALFPIFSFPAMNYLFIFLETFFGMIIWIVFFLIWIDYYFDVWIITNLRIVNIEQNGLFNRSVSEMDFTRIQDVTTEVAGIIPTFLNYGDVAVQTAAETERFLFRQVPNPYEIKDQIMQLQKMRVRQKTEELGRIIDGESL